MQVKRQMLTKRRGENRCTIGGWCLNAFGVGRADGVFESRLPNQRGDDQALGGR